MSARDRLGALGPLLAELDKPGNDVARALAHELLESHREGLAQLLDLVKGTRGADVLMHRLVADKDVAALLMLHGLHPVPLEQRVHDAVDALAGRLAAQHATLRLDAIAEGGMIQVSLEHSGKAGMYHAEIEEALAHAAADAAGVQIHETVSKTVNIDRLLKKPGDGTDT